MTATKWIPLVKFARPKDLMVAFLGAMACSVAVGVRVYPDGVLISIVAGLGLALANTFNDWVDRDLDAVGIPIKQARPLPSGAISSDAGFAIVGIYAFLTFQAIYLLWALTADDLVARVAMAYVGLIIAYSLVAKPYLGIFGHVTAALCSTALVVIPSVHARTWSLAPLALALLFLETGREMVVGCADYDAELKMGYRTAPVVYGWRRAILFSVPLTVAFLVVFPFATLTNPKLGSVYLVAGALWGGACLYCPLTYIFHPQLEEFSWLWGQVTTKVAMMVFAVALLVDVFFI